MKVILRSHTSGILTREAFFYSASRTKEPSWQLVLYYPLVYEFLDVEEKGNGLSLFTYHYGEPGEPLKIERLYVTYDALIGPF